MIRLRWLLRALSISLLAFLFAWPAVANARGARSHAATSRATYRSTNRTSGSVNVRGHVRKNSTYVAPHKRSAPDGNFNNNWTTKGNMNPYTGKKGTKVTPPPKR
jgi:hypothetical protein